jgi:hypothetical protein
MFNHLVGLCFALIAIKGKSGSEFQEKKRGVILQEE